MSQKCISTRGILESTFPFAVLIYYWRSAWLFFWMLFLVKFYCSIQISEKIHLVNKRVTRHFLLLPKCTCISNILVFVFKPVFIYPSELKLVFVTSIQKKIYSLRFSKTRTCVALISMHIKMSRYMYSSFNIETTIGKCFICVCE